MSNFPLSFLSLNLPASAKISAFDDFRLVSTVVFDDVRTFNLAM